MPTSKAPARLGASRPPLNPAPATPFASPPPVASCHSGCRGYTITTVGYGDKFSVTTEGRLIAMILMFSGVGIFGFLRGMVAPLVLR
jgi:hypothetical protein